MPRRVRDYRAEYQRRIALERQRAARENRPFSRAAARGHSRDDLSDLIRLSSPYNIEANEDAVEQSLENGVSRRELIEIYRDKLSAFKAKRAGDPSVGHGRFYADQRQQWLPIEFFYYNGQ
jgi:hypothetical protein